MVDQTGDLSSRRVKYRDAIASIESGGRYNAMGPRTNKGDRAYGKYQMMGNNIPGWTRMALGRFESRLHTGEHGRGMPCLGSRHRPDEEQGAQNKSIHGWM